jgi:large subunit ribosomal protein L21
MFVVFEAKGFQYTGSPGEKLRIPRLDSEVGKKVTFDKVLLVKNGDTQIGRPYVEGASITAEIVGHGRYEKIIVFKFKKRNRYKRTRGHRQTYTEIEIKDIMLGGKKKAENKSEEKKLEAKEEKTAKSKRAGSKTTGKKKSTKTTAKSRKKSEAPKKETEKTAKTKKATGAKKKKTASKTKLQVKQKKQKNRQVKKIKRKSKINDSEED